MAITFVLAGKKTNNLKDLADVFVNRFNNLSIQAFRIGKVSDLIVTFLTGIITQQILTEGQRGNTPYAPLLQKRKGNGILNKTGQLLEDIKRVKVMKSNGKNQENIRIMIKNKYVTYLQTGTKKMVARPIIILTRQDKEKLKEIIIQSFSKANKAKFN